MPVPFPFNWKDPDYQQVLEWRTERLARIRKKPKKLELLDAYYREHPAQFIIDWGMIEEPRNVERNLPTLIPFLLFPRQEELAEWIIERWRGQENGLVEKSREEGATCLCMCLSVTLCLFNDGMRIGFGSRKEEYVDKVGSPKPIFAKGRTFLEHLPVEFRGTWHPDRDAPHMRINFPESGSTIGGESGKDIGRGDRAGIYFVDEAAFLENPDAAEASLSQTTNCRIDVSTPNGMGCPFAQKRFAGKIPVFTLHWRADPRKDEAWYQEQVEKIDNERVIAAELDISHTASAEGLLIHPKWVQAAIGARQRLIVAGRIPLGLTGARTAALDVADEGVDRNAFAGRLSFELQHLHSWSGKGSDIYQTVVKTFWYCDEYGYPRFDYDADGLGAGVRGDANVLNEQRSTDGKRAVDNEPFRGSAAVYDPEGQMIAERKNEDYFDNFKAQSYWALAMRFRHTYRAIVEGHPFDPNEGISLDPDLEELIPLTLELSQPTYSLNKTGKICVDKTPDGTRSPNLADAVMILYNPAARRLDIWEILGQ